MKSILMVIAPEQFRDEEYARPRAILEGLGAWVVTASTWAGQCHGKLGMTVKADIALTDADPADYAAIVFVGGVGARTFFTDAAAHRLARESHAAGKIVAAICIAPSILAAAGILDGVRATAFASQEEDLQRHGAIWTGEPVTVDGSIITANGPEAARSFGKAIAEALGL